MVMKSRGIRRTGNVARMGGLRISYRILAWKRERESPRGGHGNRWDDDIKTNAKEMEWENLGSVHLAEDKEKDE
jgi:hypothetical protein